MQRCVKRGVLLFLCSVFPAFLSADTIYFQPTGYTLQPGEWKITYLLKGDAKKETLISLQSALVPFVDVLVFRENFNAGSADFGFNIQYSVSQPFPDYAPGIAVGVLDAFNKTQSGRSFFIAITWQNNIFSEWAVKERSTFTIGAGTGKQERNLFVNVKLPLYKYLSFITELDSKGVLAGLEVNWTKDFATQMIFIKGEPHFGVTFGKSF